MRIVAWAAAFLLLAPGASAQERPSTTALTCSQASSLVARYGAIVLNTGPITYERFVAGAGQCALGEYPEAARAPTLDAPQCLVGFRCRSGPAPQNEQ